MNMYHILLNEAILDINIMIHFYNLILHNYCLNITK